MAGARTDDVPGASAAAADAGDDLDAPPSTQDSMAALLGAVARAPAAPPPRDLAPGTVVDATYRIVRLLGAGGMGVVYLARDLDLQRDVALKVRRASGSTDRLQREAIAMAQLAHPNVVTVHGVGLVDGRLYVAMEHVAGQTLRGWVEAARRSWREVLAMYTAAGEGLAAAHAAGFVHRDFKPENVLVGADGRPRVGDFGLVRGSTLSSPGGAHLEATAGDDAPIAALAETVDAPTSPGASPGSVDLTATGVAIGTPAYMAPEQFGGGEVDARADQFAYCVALYEALAGRRPYRGTTFSELRAQVCEGEPEPLPRAAAPVWVWRVLRRGLARAPGARWPDMRALLAELRAAPRRRARTAALGVAVAVAAAGGGWLVGRPDRAIAPAPSCDHAAAGLAEVWNDAVRADVEARVRRVDSAGGARHAAPIVRALDRYGARYRAVAEQACRAGTIDRSWPTSLTSASVRCQASVLASVRRFLRKLDALDRDQLPLRATDVHALPRIEDCVDEQVLLAQHQAPPDPAVATRAAELVTTLSLVMDRLEEDRLDDARAIARAAAPEVEAIGFDPLTAELRMVEAHLARHERAFDTAVDRFEQAYAIATRGRATLTALQAARWLIWLHGVDRREMSAARAWIQQALPQADRYGLEHVESLGVLHAAAVVAELDADYDRAIALNQRLVDAMRGEPGLGHANALASLATSLDAAGRAAESIPIQEQAIAMSEAELGAGHPRTIYHRSNLIVAKVGAGDVAGALAVAEAGLPALDGPGVDAYDAAVFRFNHALALQAAGRLDDAMRLYQDSRPAWVALSGEASPDVADVDANVGKLLVDAGRFDEARAPLERALAVRRQHFGDDHDLVGDTLTHLGALEQGARGCAAATPRYEAAVATFRAVAERAGAHVPRAANALAGLARCRRDAGRAREAIALWREALPLAAQLGDAVVHYQVARDLGWALVAVGDLAAARDALVQARALAADTQGRADEALAIDRWLAAHPAP